MRGKRITIMFVAFCALMGTAVGGVTSMPMGASGAPTITADGSASAPVAVTGSPTPEAINGSTGTVSNCDLIDIDGNDNVVSTNITSNATGDENANVSVRIHCGADNATTIDSDFVDIDGNNNMVTLAVRAENGKLLLDSSSGSGNNNTGLDISSQCRGGTLADCDVVDIDGNNNTVNLIVESNGARTIYQFGSGSGHSTAQSNERRSATPNVSYYQVDFVTGNPIENLRGPEGYYTPDRLVRFAHGSTDIPVIRRSDGEFTTDQSVADRIESHNITVENDTAMTTFTVSEGDSVTLSLVSYTKPGPKWSPETEHLQEFVDSETHTFESGTHTLTVDLPDENSDA